MPAKKGETFPLEQLLGRELAVVFSQDRFVVEEIELRGRARHVEKDDAFGLRCDRAESLRDLPDRIAFKERSQRERAKSRSGAGEEAAAIETVDKIHSKNLTANS